MDEGPENVGERIEAAGFAVLRRLLPESEIGKLRTAIERALEMQALELHACGMLSLQQVGRAGAFDTGMAFLLERGLCPPGPPIVGPNPRATVAEPLDELRRHPAIVAAAKRLLGSRIVSTPQLAIRAHCPGRLDVCFPWHQDVFFLDIADRQSVRVLNFWIPLVPIDSRAGGLDVISGSHRHGILPHSPASSSHASPTYMSVEPDRRPKGDVVAPDLAIGDALVMTEKTVHRTRPNRSRATRWSVDIRYAPAEQPLGRSGTPLTIE